jgi:carbon-monoxide dehydrogenase medium subunit
VQRQQNWSEEQAMGQAYEYPNSVQETLELLSRYHGGAQIIAGGTDLYLELQDGKRQVDCLVDVTRIPGLARIQENGAWIEIGAAVTFRQIKESQLLHREARVLAEAADSVGALPIQTTATLAGNLVNALPAADGSVALLALDAQVAVASQAGLAWHAVEDLFLGPGQSAVDPRRQMVVSIRFPALRPGEGSAWERVGRRPGLVLPILNCGVSVGLSNDAHYVKWARIALGPVAPVPFRAREAEAYLAGRRAGAEAFGQAAELAATESQPRSSPFRASKEYRVHLVGVLVRQALTRATEQETATGHGLEDQP